MKRPTITQAKRLCSEMGGSVRAVIVLALYEDNVAGASYGENTILCKQAGYTLDKIIEGCESGAIPIWSEPWIEAERCRNIEKRLIREAIEDGTYCAVCKVPKSECDCSEIGPDGNFYQGGEL